MGAKTLYGLKRNTLDSLLNILLLHLKDPKIQQKNKRQIFNSVISNSMMHASFCYSFD